MGEVWSEGDEAGQDGGEDVKPWYQYRCEESGFGGAGLNLILLPDTNRNLSARLLRFLFYKVFHGGIHWQFSAGWSDWRAFYGSVAPEEEEA